MCLRSGWICPGYSRKWKFISENRQLSLQYRTKKYIFDAEGPPTTPHLQDLGPSELMLDICDSYQSYRQTPEFYIGVFWTLASEEDRIASRFVYILTDPCSWKLFRLETLGNFFSYIPGRLAHNAALKTAISCLCSLYTDFATNHSLCSYRTTKKYAKSLNVLQAYVKDTGSRTESGTLCASIILQICESLQHQLLSNTNNGRWVGLLRGSSILVQEYGPSRFSSRFERAMLESQRAMFIALDFFSDQPCFLSHSSWRNLAARTPGPSEFIPSDSMTMRSQLCEFLIDVPELIVGLKSIRISDPSQQSDTSLEMLRRVHDMRQRIEAWYYLRVPRTRKTPEEGGNERGELLFTVLDCVTHAVLSRLDVSPLTFISQPDAPISVYEGRTGSDRLGIARAALEEVRNRSGIAAKPLEFGNRASADMRA
ncbi:hypothetical protein MKZ38_004488 [Zalerion maritima]|uniref:Transcription factor domain-containing protein n=1 Tax=Zalerion maritima TaxID=339359 RepID=A0AAD5RLJ9_9PEZI|nr:hypothetical protein MKZ38_004488 [Zalerion maritima]